MSYFKHFVVTFGDVLCFLFLTQDLETSLSFCLCFLAQKLEMSLVVCSLVQHLEMSLICCCCCIFGPNIGDVLSFLFVVPKFWNVLIVPKCWNVLVFLYLLCQNVGMS